MGRSSSDPDVGFGTQVRLLVYCAPPLRCWIATQQMRSTNKPASLKKKPRTRMCRLGKYVPLATVCTGSIAHQITRKDCDRKHSAAGNLPARQNLKCASRKRGIYLHLHVLPNEAVYKRLVLSRIFPPPLVNLDLVLARASLP